MLKMFNMLKGNDQGSTKGFKYCELEDVMQKTVGSLLGAGRKSRDGHGLDASVGVFD
jgi:hypothetical protein